MEFSLLRFSHKKDIAFKLHVAAKKKVDVKEVKTGGDLEDGRKEGSFSLSTLSALN